METTRDLGRVELWQESLERSLARRGKLARSSTELYRLRPERDLAAPELFLDSTTYWRERRMATARRLGIPVPVVGLGGVSALALIAATTLPSLTGGSRPPQQKLAFAGHSLGKGTARSSQSVSDAVEPLAGPRAHAPARPAVARHPRPRITPPPAAPVTTTSTTAVVTQPAAPKPQPVVHRAAAPAKRVVASEEHPQAPSRHRAHAPAKPPTHPAAPKPATPTKSHTPAPPKHSPTSKHPTHKTPSPKRPVHHPAPSNGYVNPLAHTSVTPERIDQGVDYAGTGTLTALGAGRVNYVATSGSGWPGAFIEYQLLSGPYAGRFVYYAEGVSPASGIYVGRTLEPGQPVASLIPGWSTGIEIGWGAGIGSETLAAERHDWTPYDDAHNIPSPEGASFSALIASLGGPPGT